MQNPQTQTTEQGWPEGGSGGRAKARKMDICDRVNNKKEVKK